MLSGRYNYQAAFYGFMRQHDGKNRYA